MIYVIGVILIFILIFLAILSILLFITVIVLDDINFTLCDVRKYLKGKE